MTFGAAETGLTLVTGAGGHLGNNLVRALVADGVAVRAMLHTPAELPSVAGLPLDTVIGDLRDRQFTQSSVRGCTRVYHCAARISTKGGGESELFESNVGGTRALLDAAQAARVEKIVVTSSFSAVGHLHDHPSDETVPFDPFGFHLPYERTKAAAEHECLKAYADGLPVVIATSTAILGPNDWKPSRMGRVLLDFARGRLPAYIPGGFEFVSTADIVDGHRLAMVQGRPGQKYIFSSGYRSMDAIFDACCAVTGRARRPMRLSPGLMRGIAEISVRIGAIVTPRAEPLLTPAAIHLLRLGRRADVSKAQRELGFQPGSIEGAIEAAYRDFVRRGLLTPDVLRQPGGHTAEIVRHACVSPARSN